MARSYGPADCYQQPTSPNYRRRNQLPWQLQVPYRKPHSSRKSPIGRSGVLTLSGFGIKVRMQCGHLETEDGIGPERRKDQAARVSHGLRRLVMIGSDGFITLEALRWISDMEPRS